MRVHPAFKEMNNSLCIYHANCDDGFAAAWVVNGVMREREELCDFFAAEYNQEPPNVTGKRVYIVDFSYPLETLTAMAKVAEFIIVLDHHKTTQAALENFTAPNVQVRFDMKKCGAMLTWDWFNPDVEPPQFLEYIQDRDLWTKKLEFIEEFSMAVRSYPKEFEAWDLLAAKTVSEMIREGGAILRYNRRLIEQHKAGAYKHILGGKPCMMVNAPVCYFL